MSDWTKARGKVAALTRSRTPDDPELVEARNKLRESRAAHEAERFVAYVERIVAEAPPLTDEQRDKLAVLLRGGGDAA